MATHGCLLITDRNNDRTVMLHTHHTGMDIPRVVPLAFDIIANYYDFLATYKSKDLEGRMCRGLTIERLQYGPSAAAVLIASKPCFLEPVTDESREDLPTWSGIDTPYELKIIGQDWLLYDQEKNLINEWNVFNEVRDRIMALPPEQCLKN